MVSDESRKDVEMAGTARVHYHHTGVEVYKKKITLPDKIFDGKIRDSSS